MTGRSRAVLITGCSTGIGHATAARLARGGWPVYATARRPETLAELETAGCRTLRLDVTDEASMCEAVETVRREHGAVGALVNNAGYGLEGPVEEIPLDEARRQFETNVFGAARLCQLVLPGMREQGWGRIVNVSSLGGRLTFPGGGWYHASKHALEAYSDALRYEVRGFGVDVVLIEPGIIRTAFGDTATTELARTPDGPYTEFRDGVARRMRLAYSGWMAALSTGPETVAGTIERAVSAERPKTRYRITPAARMALLTRRLSTDRMFDAMLRLFFPASGRTK